MAQGTSKQWKQLLQSSENQEEESWDDLRRWHPVRQNSGSGKKVCLRKGEVFHVSSVQLQEPAHWLITNDYTNKSSSPTNQLANLHRSHQKSTLNLITQQIFSKRDHHQ